MNVLPKTLILIHGVSAVGKTTIGKMLSDELNAFYLDQDDFYLKDKPQVIFTDDQNNKFTGSNWDSIEAIDFENFNTTIITLLENDTIPCIVITGFALLPKYMQDLYNYLECNSNIFLKSFLLSFRLSESKIIECIIEFRQHKFKELTKEKMEKDKWMIKRIVWPFYLFVLKNIKYDLEINVYENGTRRAKKDILNEILNNI